jgi:UDP-galactopyranose mutase
MKINKILIVGAGPVGCTVAETLSTNKVNITIVDKRKHIAGNCYDYKNKQGILVHKYGPHYFRTDNKNIIKYLSNFTKWIKGDYFVKSYYKKELYDFPINLNTLEKFYKKKFSENSARIFLGKISKINKKQNNFEDYLKSKIGVELYDAFYKNYTKKQWGLDPRNLSTKLAKRVPLYFDRSRNYIKAKYKLMPKFGFTQMFKKMIEKKNINVKLGTLFTSDMLSHYDLVVYTGPVDFFFKYSLGKLKWRSLDFKFTTKKKSFLQESVQINYPNDFKFTRSVEYKHVTKQKSKFTTISREFPKSDGEPYYPINTKENSILYKKYLRKIKPLIKKNIFFCGRLAEYTYINTDEAINRGLRLAKKIQKIIYKNI